MDDFLLPVSLKERGFQTVRPFVVHVTVKKLLSDNSLLQNGTR